MKHIKLIILIIASTSLFAQTDLSLSDAIKKGLENNYQIQVSNRSLEIAKNNNTIGEAGMLPSAGINVYQGNRFDNRPNAITGIEEEYTTNSLVPGLSVNWLLFSGFALKTTKSTLDLLEKSSVGNSSIVVENTIQAIVLAYYKALLEKEKMEIVSKVMLLSRDRYNNQLTRKELGSAVTYDVLLAKNAYLSDSSTVLLQQMNVKNSLMNLNLLLADTSGGAYNLTDDFNTNVYDYKIEDLLAKLSSNNSTIKNQYINQEILRNNIKLSKSQLYPTLALSSGADLNNSRITYKNIDPVDAEGYDYYLNFSLSFNIFNGGKTKRAIQNAIIQEDIGQIRLDEMEQNLSIVLTTMLDFYNVRKQLYLVALENMESAELNLQLSEERFNSGIINSFNYRDVQLLYQNTALRKLEALYNLVDSNTELLRLTGGIISEY